jgi:hypothetical protein
MYSKGVFPQPWIHVAVATATNAGHANNAASREAVTLPCPRTSSFFAPTVAVPDTPQVKLFEAMAAQNHAISSLATRRAN